MDGIDAAFTAGFDKVKVNTVLMRDVNHHQLDTFLAWIKPRRIQLRFIELMETGEGSELFRRHHISGMVLRDELLKRGWIHQIRQRSDGPAQVFCHSDYEGEIGLIMPYEKDFCASCNRLRVSSVGKLHLCLFGDGGVDLRELLEDDAQQDALEAARLALSLFRPVLLFLPFPNVVVKRMIPPATGCARRHTKPDTRLLIKRSSKKTVTPFALRSHSGLRVMTSRLC